MRISIEEMPDRLAKGLCNSYQEKFSWNHRCSMKEIYLLKLDEEEDMEDDNDHVEILLHALTGIHTGRTMQLSVKINGRELLDLVDSGATHSFLAEVVA